MGPFEQYPQVVRTYFTTKAALTTEDSITVKHALVAARLHYLSQKESLVPPNIGTFIDANFSAAEAWANGWLNAVPAYINKTTNFRSNLIAILLYALVFCLAAGFAAILATGGSAVSPFIIIGIGAVAAGLCGSLPNVFRNYSDYDLSNPYHKAFIAVIIIVSVAAMIAGAIGTMGIGIPLLAFGVNLLVGTLVAIAGNTHVHNTGSLRMVDSTAGFDRVGVGKNETDEVYKDSQENILSYFYRNKKLGNNLPGDIGSTNFEGRYKSDVLQPLREGYQSRDARDKEMDRLYGGRGGSSGLQANAGLAGLLMHGG